MIYTDPHIIEENSMRIIASELESRGLLDSIPGDRLPVVKRVIHSTADFDFAKSLVFSDGFMEQAAAVMKNSPRLVTDTNMIAAGINKKALESLGGSIRCYMSDQETMDEAGERSSTRAVVCMERAARETPDAVFIIGNAPTALLRLCELAHEGAAAPSLVIGVPVGFVNVVESKETLLALAGVPRVVSTGLKGGSTVAVAIINAIMYEIR
jgi:precorrin-8X/cobalt-precorrin-8 methylmutase